MNKIKGILLIDKPKGKTSPQITREISEKLNIKTGHCGALDPYATGVLPITIGKAVKIQEYLQKKDKEYLVEIKTEREISTEKMKKALNKFQGKITQIPPEKSAVKRRKREREIYSIKHLEKKRDIHKFKVKCQHGTYIRTLVKDLSEKLGVEITLKNLIRTETGKWNEKNTYKLKEVNELIEKKEIKRILIPIRKSLSEFPKIEIKKTALKSISHGEDLKT
ncbi:MAG: RNA-guided pseudouridylation complex pseudouridine synthase subunit Cbf5, partial [archaeon]